METKKRRWPMFAAGVALLFAFILLGVWTAAGYAGTENIETPKYTVLGEGSGYELREYAGHIRAEVTLEGEYRDTLYAGFRKVADYIFGNNSPNAKIAMTAPVLQEESAPSAKIAMTAPVLQEPAGESGGRHTVSFIMPSEYTMDSLPRPNNPEVVLREVPPHRMAAVAFAGYATEGAVKKKTAALLAALARDGVTVTGTPQTAQYNPPWTPPYMRKNEILVPVE